MTGTSFSETPVTETPGTAELLRLARDTVLNDLLAALPEDKRYAARQVANAMAIAAREIEGVGAAAEARLAALRVLYAAAAADGMPAEALWRRLAADIRRGAFDDRADVHALLTAHTRARLALSNPKALG